VLVDGDHSAEGVRKDLENLLRYRPATPLFVVMHDSFNPECRRGLRTTNWVASPYVHAVELDFVPGTITASPSFLGQLWGGLALAYLKPQERRGHYWPPGCAAPRRGTKSWPRSRRPRTPSPRPPGDCGSCLSLASGRRPGAVHLPSGIASPPGRPSGPAAGKASFLHPFLPQCRGRPLTPAQDGGEVPISIDPKINGRLWGCRAAREAAEVVPGTPAAGVAVTRAAPARAGPAAVVSAADADVGPGQIDDAGDAFSGVGAVFAGSGHGEAPGSESPTRRYATQRLFVHELGPISLL
jgi:hypothetical protein